MSPRWRRFRKGPDDTLVVSLSPEEVGLLANLPDELRLVFEAPADDAVAQRLFPQSRLDPSAEEAEEFTASLGRATENKDMREIALSPDDVQAWLGVLNDTRLVLGTQLGVTEDEPDIDLDAPEARSFAVYYWLTGLQGDLIEMLL